METARLQSEDSDVLGALGSAIRTLRKGKGISQEELSHLSRLDGSHMGRIERGERNVTIINLVRISRGLSCSPSEILKAAGL